MPPLFNEIPGAERYRALSDAIDTGFVILEVVFDASGAPEDCIFVEANPAFRKHTGLDEVVGKSVRSTVRGLEEFWFETYGRIARTGVAERFEHRAEALNRWFSVHAFPIDERHLNHVAVLFEDVKERRVRELHAAFIDEIGEQLTRISSPDEIMRTVGARIGEFLGVSGCVFCDVDEERDAVTINHGWTVAQVPSLKRTFKLSDYLTPEFARVNRAGEDFVVRDTALDERTDAANYSRLEIGAFVVSPILRGGHWVAYLALTSIAPRDWRDDEVDLVRALSDRMFSRIERARAEALRQSSEDRWAFLLRLGEAFRRDADEKAIGLTTVRALAAHLHADRCYIATLARGDGTARVVSEFFAADLEAMSGTQGYADFPGFMRRADTSPLLMPDVQNASGASELDKASMSALDMAAVIVVRFPECDASTLEYLVVASATLRAWTVDDLRLVEAVALLTKSKPGYSPR